MESEGHSASNSLSYDLNIVSINTIEGINRMLSDLKDVTLIAIDLEGERLSKDGEVCILQISLGRHSPVYLVDIFEMGSRAFEDTANGSLKFILENSSISKLIWDVRCDSNALFHIFGISLQGVIDLQVWELGCRFFEDVNMTYLNGLGHAIERDLKLTPEEQHRIVYVKQAARHLFSPVKGGSFAIWKVRPLPEVLVEYCTDTRFLFELRESYNNRLKESLNNLFAIQKSTSTTHQQPNNSSNVLSQPNLQHHVKCIRTTPPFTEFFPSNQTLHFLHLSAKLAINCSTNRRLLRSSSPDYSTVRELPECMKLSDHTLLKDLLRIKYNPIKTADATLRYVSSASSECEDEIVSFMLVKDCMFPCVNVSAVEHDTFNLEERSLQIDDFRHQFEDCNNNALEANRSRNRDVDNCINNGADLRLRNSETELHPNDDGSEDDEEMKWFMFLHQQDIDYCRSLSLTSSSTLHHNNYSILPHHFSINNVKCNNNTMTFQRKHNPIFYSHAFSTNNNMQQVTQHANSSTAAPSHSPISLHPDCRPLSCNVHSGLFCPSSSLLAGNATSGGGSRVHASVSSPSILSTPMASPAVSAAFAPPSCTPQLKAASSTSLSIDHLMAPPLLILSSPSSLATPNNCHNHAMQGSHMIRTLRSGYKLCTEKVEGMTSSSSSTGSIHGPILSLIDPSAKISRSNNNSSQNNFNSINNHYSRNDVSTATTTTEGGQIRNENGMEDDIQNDESTAASAHDAQKVFLSGKKKTRGVSRRERRRRHQILLIQPLIASSNANFLKDENDETVVAEESFAETDYFAPLQPCIASAAPDTPKLNYNDYGSCGIDDHHENTNDKHFHHSLEKNKFKTSSIDLKQSLSIGDQSASSTTLQLSETATTFSTVSKNFSNSTCTTFFCSTSPSTSHKKNPNMLKLNGEDRTVFRESKWKGDAPSYILSPCTDFLPSSLQRQPQIRFNSDVSSDSVTTSEQIIVTAPIVIHASSKNDPTLSTSSLLEIQSSPPLSTVEEVSAAVSTPSQPIPTKWGNKIPFVDKFKNPPPPVVLTNPLFNQTKLNKGEEGNSDRKVIVKRISFPTTEVNILHHQPMQHHRRSYNDLSHNDGGFGRSSFANDNFMNHNNINKNEISQRLSSVSTSSTHQVNNNNMYNPSPSSRFNGNRGISFQQHNKNSRDFKSQFQKQDR